MEIHEVSKEQASTILLNRWPIGLFLIKDDDKYVGIDNSTGDVWAEEFEHRRSATQWLLRE